MIPSLSLGGVSLMRRVAAGNSLDVNDVFGIATWTGDGAGTRDIQPDNGPLDMTGGGLIWIRGRNTGQNGAFFWSVDGTNIRTTSSTSGATVTTPSETFTSSGISLASATHNVSGRTYMALFFKKAPRFLDILSYTGNGSNRTIAHSLGVAPGVVWFKGTGSTAWHMHHRDLGNATRKQLIGPLDSAADANYLNSTSPDASNLSLGTGTSSNQNTVNYFAFLFAHDTASDGVIQACTYTGNGNATGPSVTTMGWHPNLVFTIPDSTSSPYLWDQVRSPGFSSASDGAVTLNNNNTETGLNIGLVTDGFQLLTNSGLVNASGQVYYGLTVRAS